VEFDIKSIPPKPFFWNNYFAPLFQFITMSNAEAMEDDHVPSEVEGHDDSSRESSDTSSSKRSGNRKITMHVADLGIAKISKIIEEQLGQDQENQRNVEDTSKPCHGFITPSETIQAPTTQETRPLWKYRLTLIRRRNASAHTTPMLDLFKSFVMELFY